MVCYSILQLSLTIGAKESYLTHLVRSGDCLDDVGEVYRAGGEALDMLSGSGAGDPASYLTYI